VALLALASLAPGCGAAQDRPEPPSGAVDPGLHGLDPPAPAPPAAPASGKMVMTRERCEALGRKFTELALKQGGVLGALGVDSAGEAEAAGVGRTFSERCVRDLGGQEVEVAEYQCMLRAESPDGLTACRK
jgi:hypothetical protein